MYKKVCDFVDNTHTICTNFERIEFNLAEFNLQMQQNSD